MKRILFTLLILSFSKLSFGQDTLPNICTDNSIEGINKAIDFYKKRLEKDCNDQRAYYVLGMCHYRLIDLKTAIQYFDQLIALNPKYEAAYSNRGLCKMFLKDRVGACADFAQSIKNGENPKSIDGKKLSTYVKKECPAK